MLRHLVFPREVFATMVALEFDVFARYFSPTVRVLTEGCEEHVGERYEIFGARVRIVKDLVERDTIFGAGNASCWSHGYKISISETDGVWSMAIYKMNVE